MKQRFPSLAGAYRRRRSHLSALLLALVASGFAVPVGAQAPAAPIARAVIDAYLDNEKNQPRPPAKAAKAAT